MIDRTNDARTLQVRKRDGSTERFVYSKLIGCLRNSLCAGGEVPGCEAGTANDLGEAVYEYLKSTSDGTPVESRQLFELVEMILKETGHATACMALRQHAGDRDRLRRRVLVAGVRPSDGRIIHRRWKKAHLVRHLRQRQGLEAPVGRMIAGRVEDLVLNCGLRVVTSGLVHEMMRSELLAWGLLPGALVVNKARASRPLPGFRPAVDESSGD